MTTQRNISSRTSTSSTTSSGKEMTALQFISQDDLFRLFEEQKGAQYFIPEGFEPVLIPRNSNINIQSIETLKSLQQQQILLQKQQLKLQQSVVNMTSTVPLAKNNTSDVKFPQLVLARTAAQTPRSGTVAKTKQKKPPRPPNAFILYRRSKQPDIVAANEGISNNEVSKQIGEMWHKESVAEKQKFQLMADQAKIEHLKKFPDYKYRPRKPHEKRRRTKRPSASLGNSNIMASAVANVVKDGTGSFMANGNSPDIDETLLRRSSIDTTCSFDEDDSRRSSILSTCDINDLNDLENMGYDQNNLFENSVPISSMVDESTQFQYPAVLDSPEGYNACVETNAFNLMMEGVSPSSETDLNPLEFYEMYTNEQYDYLSSLGLSPFISPDSGMINLSELDS
ncbi:10481_t:CDS:1 [Acaulospora colombiana]|uniref:10481_t:CDS:1 n=1 Tax=Acaulospora colombiana TaxID=27376 RepID=A0ACA9KFM4_9GLOM|nr:10481_t:CDS:1 [Acaulospora colombiana]